MCEQGHFDHLIGELDSTLLLHLALGHTCLIYDFGSRNKKRGTPRAIWYGLEFIRYVLERVWLKQQGRAFLRGHDVRKEFEIHLRALLPYTRKRLKYFASYMPEGGLECIKLYGVYKETEHDIDLDYYRGIAHDWLGPKESFSVGSGKREGGKGGETNSYSSLVCSPSAAENELLHSLDVHKAVEEMFGMRLYLGGVSHSEYLAWQERAENNNENEAPSPPPSA